MATSLRVEWDAGFDANLKFWRIYMSDTASEKGILQAEINPSETSYLIRDVGEEEVWVRVVAVSLAGTEEEWRNAASQHKVVSSGSDKASKVTGVERPLWTTPLA